MNKRFAALFLALGLVAIGGAAAAAGKSWTETDLLKANEARLVAFQKADLAALDKLLADELVYTHAHALVQNKAQLLDSIRTGDQTYRKIAVDDLKTIAIPGGGIVTGHMVMTAGKDPAKPVQLDNRFTAVLVDKGGELKLVAFESTRIPPPPAPPAAAAP
jgi:hypothetical protein